jgi:hypothetical protein
MTRRLQAVLPTIWFIGCTIGWITVAGGLSLDADSRDRAGAGIDPRSLDLLADKNVQERLGLSDDQRPEVERRLALCLNRDQDDLIRMILNQYHADRDRLRDLEHPGFDDDEDDLRDEMTRLRSMAGGFGDRAAAMVDRVLTPGQRAASGRRSCPSDLDALLQNLSDLQRENLRGLAATLTRGQQDQLMELTLQAEGPLAVVRPVVSARLGLNLDKKKRIRAIWKSAQVDLDRLLDPSPISPAYREGDDLDLRMRPRLSTIRKESARILATAAERIREVL